MGFAQMAHNMRCFVRMYVLVHKEEISDGLENNTINTQVLACHVHASEDEVGISF